MDLFRDKTRNLLGLPMSVAILNHLPAVKRLSKTEYIGETSVKLHSKLMNYNLIKIQ